MSDREDTKLREVVVATFPYRHEAEFAAGFLEDAGIPFRLQIDDPALGISMSTSAKIWVAAMDERRARAILQEDRAVAADDEWSPEDVADRLDEPAEGPPVVRGTPSRMKKRRSSPTTRNTKPDLTLRQRLVALGGSVAVASSLGVEAVRGAGDWAVGSVAFAGAALAVVAMVGRAPGFLQRLLSAISGDAP